MSTSEPLSAEPKPGSRFQYSLRAMFGLTTGTAAFFALGRMLGYADAIVILAGVVITVAVMEYPHRVHLATGILLTLVAGALLWANLRPTRWEREFNQLPPTELDPMAKAMFYRGWPLSPFMICLTGPGMQLHASDAEPYVVLVFDAAIFVVILFLVRATCEFCCRRLDKPIIEMLGNMRRARRWWLIAIASVLALFIVVGNLVAWGMGASVTPFDLVRVVVAALIVTVIGTRPWLMRVAGKRRGTGL